MITIKNKYPSPQVGAINFGLYLKTYLGHYEFTMMPFSLINGPMAFMDLRNRFSYPI